MFLYWYVANVLPSIPNFNVFLLPPNSPCPLRSQLHHFPSCPHFTMLLPFRNRHVLSVPKLAPSVPRFFPSVPSFSNVISFQTSPIAFHPKRHHCPSVPNCVCSTPFHTSRFSFRSRLHHFPSAQAFISVPNIAHFVSNITVFLLFQASPT